MIDLGEPLWTPRQAATFLGVAELTLADWRSDGKGPPFVKLRDGRANSPVRYVPATLRAWIEERTRDPLA